MPVADIKLWTILYTIARYLLPLFALTLVFLILSYILSESRNRRERIRSLPGSGNVGELIVLSGGKNLEINTWFPVPREGVLGSIRSCDLVIPCPGVHTKHLDFTWEDGLGLLIHPRTGCEAFVNGATVTCRTDMSAVPLTHGSVLQVGSAVLRLHLFAALDNTTATVQPAPPDSVVPVQAPLFMQGTLPTVPYPTSVPAAAPEMSVSPGAPLSPSDTAPAPASSPSSPDAQTVHKRRSDCWKEDFGE